MNLNKFSSYFLKKEWRDYLKFLIKYFKTYRLPFIPIILCLTIEAICDLLQPTIMASIIDNGVARKDLNFVTQMGLLMLGITFIGAMANGFISSFPEGYDS